MFLEKCMFRNLLTGLLALIAITSSSGATAQEKAGWKEGFSLSENSGRKIVLFRPNVRVGSQSTGGLFEPNVDWTEQAKSLLNLELAKVQGQLGNEVVQMPELIGNDARTMAEYDNLFSTVAASVVEYQFFSGNRLPTKKRGGFDWTLGADISRLKELSGADYGLFLYTEDQYGSFGRKAFQFLAAGLLGAGISSGVHKGYAGLVDLNTGDLVWLNADFAMGGDVRTEEGMTKRVSQLFEDFPGSKTFAKNN